jgi:hypothetical protein
MELLSGHEKIITKSGISLNVGTLNQSYTVVYGKVHLRLSLHKWDFCNPEVACIVLLTCTQPYPGQQIVTTACTKGRCGPKTAMYSHIVVSNCRILFLLGCHL